VIAPEGVDLEHAAQKLRPGEPSRAERSGARRAMALPEASRGLLGTLLGRSGCGSAGWRAGLAILGGCGSCARSARCRAGFAGAARR
jgi:hypothetical protein